MIEEINVKGNKLYIMPHEKRLFENQVCCEDCMCEELNGCDSCLFENDNKIYNCDERITRSDEKLVMVELEHGICWGLLNKTYNQALEYKINCRDIYCSNLKNDCNDCCFQNEEFDLKELNYKILD